MIAIIKKDDEEIIVLDTNNLIDSKYFDIDEDLPLYNEDGYSFYINDDKVDYQYFINEVDEKLESLELKGYDDKSNEQIIFIRVDGTKFAIKYSKTY